MRFTDKGGKAQMAGVSYWGGADHGVANIGYRRQCASDVSLGFVNYYYNMFSIGEVNYFSSIF